MEIQLLDNGKGADLIAEDGIYSRFFTKYGGITGRYTLKCKVRHNIYRFTIVLSLQANNVLSYHSRLKEMMDRFMLLKRLLPKQILPS